MKNNHRDNDWERRLRPFPAVWDRVMGPPPGRPKPPPFMPPPPPPPPGPFPPPPPLKPGCGPCSRAVRFNPRGRRG